MLGFGGDDVEGAMDFSQPLIVFYRDVQTQEWTWDTFEADDEEQAACLAVLQGDGAVVLCQGCLDPDDVIEDAKSLASYHQTKGARSFAVYITEFLAVEHKVLSA